MKRVVKVTCLVIIIMKIQSPGPPYVANRRFKNKRVFWKGSHWSDKCEVITDPSARKEFLKSARRCFLCLKEGHLSRNCQTKPTCYYCKGFHNSSVCETRETQRLLGNPQSTNSVNNKNFILFQTADVILFNDFNKNEVRIKALFDGGSQRIASLQNNNCSGNGNVKTLIWWLCACVSPRKSQSHIVDQKYGPQNPSFNVF